MTQEALSRYLLRNRKAEAVQAIELYRREVALAELQDLIFVNDTRAYLEHSLRGRLVSAYIKEHWAEVMGQLQAAMEKKTGRGLGKGDGDVSQPNSF